MYVYTTDNHEYRIMIVKRNKIQYTIFHFIIACAKKAFKMVTKPTSNALKSSKLSTAKKLISLLREMFVFITYKRS